MSEMIFNNKVFNPSLAQASKAQSLVDQIKAINEAIKGIYQELTGVQNAITGKNAELTSLEGKPQPLSADDVNKIESLKKELDALMTQQKEEGPKKYEQIKQLIEQLFQKSSALPSAHAEDKQNLENAAREQMKAMNARTQSVYSETEATALKELADGRAGDKIIRAQIKQVQIKKAGDPSFADVIKMISFFLHQENSSLTGNSPTKFTPMGGGYNLPDFDDSGIVKELSGEVKDTMQVV